MKRVILCLAIALLNLSAYSHEPNRNEELINWWLQKQENIQRQKDELMSTRHQVRFGISLSNSSLFNYDVYRETVNPTLSIDYSYRILEFLELGASFSARFAEGESEFSHSIGFTSPYTINARQLSLGLYARYSWFNRSWISLYSAAGYTITDTAYSPLYQKTYLNIIERGNTTILPYLNLIGIRLGGKFFVYFEPLIIANRGLQSDIGVGFKF